MEETINTDKMYDALRTLIINSLLNSYAVERVAFGYEQPGNQVPIDLYLKHLGLDVNGILPSCSDIAGTYIDEQERINAEKDRAEFVRDLFVEQTERIFMDVPQDIRSERADEEIPLAPRFRQYLFGLLPLFTEVINVQVEYSAFDVLPADGEKRVTEYPEWKKFVTDILIKPLKEGSQINRYVKDITTAPHYVRRLIQQKDNNYFLKSADTDDYEYIFALFSLMQFMNDANNKIFELKMLEWERIHKSE